MEVILFNSRDELMKTVDNYGIVTVRIDSKIMCLTRVGEEVFLFESKCPHFDHPMENAKVSPAGKVTCTWHNYQFDLNTGEESESRCRSMKTSRAYYNSSGQLIVNY